MAPLSIHLSDYLRATCPNMRLGAIVASLAAVGDPTGTLDEALSLAVSEVLSEQDPVAHPRLEAMAETFRRAGANPSRYAPAATALIKRLHQGKGLYRINALVDTNNLLSLKLRIPCGIYDRAHVSGSRLTYDLGAPQASYLGIDGIEQKTQAKLLLTDEAKVLGGPHADAAPTRITDATRHFLCVMYYPDTPDSPLAVTEELTRAGQLFETHCGATILATLIAQ